MGSIIIAMPRREDANRISSLLKNSRMTLDINICETGADVLRVANERDFGVVICGKRLRDMSYVDMAEYLPSYFGSIILTKDSSLEIFRDDMVKLVMPFRNSDLIDTIDMMTQGFNRSIRKRRTPLKRNEEDKKIIDEAKLMLMDRNSLSEEEAFRYIQKNSMDYGRKMVESARMILSLYSESGDSG